VVISCGTSRGSAGAEKVGTGGREGVAGGAFSLSALCDSWLAVAFEVLGREGRSVTAGAVGFEIECAGSLGNSLTICETSQICQSQLYFSHYLI
jgi:hypothetical protein